MAKSTRSKVKRAFRHKKREEGVYAATEAARLKRLSAKLQQVVQTNVDVAAMEQDADEEKQDTRVPDDDKTSNPRPDATTTLSEPLTRISTHGPRGSRREEWRKSKGLSPRANPRGINRQGGVAARRKAGRSKRRR